MHDTVTAHQQPTIPENVMMIFIEINLKKTFENTVKFYLIKYFRNNMLVQNWDVFCTVKDSCRS